MLAALMNILTMWSLANSSTCLTTGSNFGALLSLPTRCASYDQVLADVRFVAASGMSRTLKTFSVRECNVANLTLRAALETGSSVLVGVWLGKSLSQNDAELNATARLLSRTAFHPYVHGVVVGSETQFRKDITFEQLAGYVTRVRGILDGAGMARTRLYVVDAQPALLADPRLFGIPGVDVVLANIYPSFGGSSIAAAKNTFAASYLQLWSLGMGVHGGAKRLGVGETGWPSQGGPTSTVANQVAYMQGAAQVCRELGIECFWFFPFDEPWKGPANTTEVSLGITLADRRSFKPGMLSALRNASRPESCAPRVPPSVTPSYSYVTCLADSPAARIMPYRLISRGVNSVARCADAAARFGMPFFGLQWNSECWAALTEPRGAMLPVARCMLQCTGVGGVGTATILPECGGSRSMAVYGFSSSSAKTELEKRGDGDGDGEQHSSA
jgi:exo-beta-1,3-glucanase (GH17 family)